MISGFHAHILMDEMMVIPVLDGQITLNQPFPSISTGVPGPEFQAPAEAFINTSNGYHTTHTQNPAAYAFQPATSVDAKNDGLSTH